MRHDKLLKSIVGEEVFDSLSKALQKLSTNSVVDIGELYHSLKIVPKAVVSFLVRELKDLKDPKEIKIPWADNASMLVNKLENDVYKGHLSEDGKITHEFQLTSLPALAAHLTSHFELYDQDDIPALSGGEENKEKSAEHKLIHSQLQLLDAKINHILSMVANKPQEKPKEELHKAGTMPKMPHPPSPGAKVGGKQGVAQTGIMGAKTAATDRLSKPVKQLNKPQLNTTKIKSITFNKSDLMKNCMECRKSEFDDGGNYTGCLCWHGMSKPKVKKNEKDKVTLEFGDDWDSDALVALIRSVKKYGRNDT